MDIDPASQPIISFGVNKNYGNKTCVLYGDGATFNLMYNLAYSYLPWFGYFIMARYGPVIKDPQQN